MSKKEIEKEVAEELQELISAGLVKAIHKDGQTLYQLTEEGKKAAQEMAQIDPDLN